MRTSLSDLDNEMMEDGTFVYGSLSAVQQILLFKEYETTYSLISHLRALNEVLKPL